MGHPLGVLVCLRGYLPKLRPLLLLLLPRF